MLDILTARKRSDTLPRALECDDNGTLYVSGGGAGVAVTIADGADVAQGATTDAESAVGNGTVIAILKRLRTLLAGGLPAALGRATMAASLPVVLATEQMPDDSAVFTPASDPYMPIGGEFDDAGPAGLAEGQGGAVRMSSRREFYITIRDAAGNERGVNVDANNRIGVTVGAGEAHVGEVGGNSVFKDVTLSLDTNPYADGDVLAEVQEITTAMRVNGGMGRLTSIEVTDKDDQGQPFDIVFFQVTASLGTENNPVSISDADAIKKLGVVEILASDYVDYINSRSATKRNIGLKVGSAGGSTSIFVGAISRGTGTYTASGIHLRIGLSRD